MAAGTRVGESLVGGSAKVEVGERVGRMMKSGRGVVWKSGAGEKMGKRSIGVCRIAYFYVSA